MTDAHRMLISPKLDDSVLKEVLNRYQNGYHRCSITIGGGIIKPPLKHYIRMLLNLSVKVTTHFLRDVLVIGGEMCANHYRLMLM